MSVLQPAEKSAIRLWLGFADQWRDHNTRLESVLDNVSPEAVDQIRVCLVKLTEVEEKISTIALPNAGVSRVDEISFFKNTAVFQAQIRIGRMYVSRLSIILGVPVYSDPFSTGGYLGDKFSGPPEGGSSGFFNVG